MRECQVHSQDLSVFRLHAGAISFGRPVALSADSISEQIAGPAYDAFVSAENQIILSTSGPVYLNFYGQTES